MRWHVQSNVPTYKDIKNLLCSFILQATPFSFPRLFSPPNHLPKPMEALNFLKFWRPIVSKSTDIEIPPPLGDDDDDFFELQLSLADLDTKNSKAKKDSPSKIASSRRPSSIQPSLSPSPRNLFSKRKIIPIGAQPTPRLQLNVSLFNSTPKFRVSMFSKSKSMPNPTKAGETDEPPYLNGAKSSLLSNTSKFSSLQNGETNGGMDGSSSKRFSEDGMQRYLKLVKPFYVKGSERGFEDLKLFSGNLSRASPSSPSIARMFVAKEKMALVNGGVSPARNDDSWAQHHDGIQGAILHCKKSFHSSRGIASHS